MATHDPVALLRAKAASYRSDALKWQTDAALRARVGPAEADDWAREYTDVARELDKVAATLGEAAPPPVVCATNDELVLVLKGNELTLATDQGGRVKLRLPKVDELLAGQAAAGLTGMTRAQAEAMCRPIPPGVL